MAHDAQRAQPSSTSEAGQTSPIKSPQKNPPEFQHLRDTSLAGQPLNPQSTSPTEPKSPTISRASSILTRASPLSLLQSSHSRAPSATSQKQRPSRISVRDLTISPPMGTPDLAPSVADNEEQPFSPRSSPACARPQIGRCNWPRGGEEGIFQSTGTISATAGHCDKQQQQSPIPPAL